MPTALVPPPWTPTDREFRRLTPDEFRRLFDANVLADVDDVEWREGLVVHRCPPWGGAGGIEDQYRFSVEQYYRMADAGVLAWGEKVELLEGLLVKKMVIHPPHTTAVEKTRDALFLRIPPGWIVRGPQPITLTAGAPEPDGAVARGTRDDYAARHPTPADLGLVVEVSDSSLPTDRGPKARMYGATGIHVYWIVNLIDDQVEVMTQPTPTGYAHTQVHLPGDAVPLTLDGVAAGAIAVNDLLP